MKAGERTNTISHIIQHLAGWSLTNKIKNQLTHCNNLFPSRLRNILVFNKSRNPLALDGQPEWLSIAQNPITTVSRIPAIIKLSPVLNKYLPHTAIVLLAMIVAISNWHDKAAADTIYDKLIYVEPAAQFSIVQNIDNYTPLISNDADLVHKSSTPSVAQAGFVSAQGPVETAITEREEPLPDNSTKTVMYTVRDGDTLTGIGWKFGVKLATLQYVNNLDNTVIRPGISLKIPPTGYEVSANQIAQRQKEKNAKLALANSRSTVARAASSSRSGDDGPAGYVGTIDGVKYVRRAKPYESQCYTYVTSQGYGVGGHLLAKWIPTNSDSPRVGGLVVTYESWAGHVAVVTGVNGDGTFNIRESNYTHGWITERTMSVNSSKIKGFVN